MSVSFNQVPPNLLVPFVAVEFDASQASQGPALLAYRVLLLGQKTSEGTAAADTLHRVTNASQVSQLAGRGSMLHRQALAWFANNTLTELWIGVLADAGAGVAATGELAFTGPAAANGTVALYLGGERITVGVADEDTADEIAEAVEAAINADEDLPVTAVQGEDADSHKVTITFRHKGLVGNSYDVRHSYRDGEALPAGVGLTITGMADGETNPDLDDVIAAMGDQWFHLWAHPYTDSGSLDAIEAELADRSEPLRAIDGDGITSAAGTFGDLVTLGDGRNSEHTCLVSQPGQAPLTPPMEFSAKIAAIAAPALAADPARPLQTLAVRRALPPAEADLFTLEERNQLLEGGVATTRTAAGGVVQIERLVTTYTENAAGAPDTAYRDLNTKATLRYLRFSFRTRMQTRYPRHKLADDGVRVGPGQAVMTPKQGAAEATAWFEELEELGLVENAEQFARDLVVVRNAQDPNRLDFLLPPDLMNQLRVQAAQIAYRL